MAASLRGESVVLIEERAKALPVKKDGIFSKFHSLYVAPLIVGTILFVIGKIW